MNKYEKQITISLTFYNVFGVLILIMNIIRRLNGIYTYSTEYIILLALIFLPLNGNDISGKERMKNPLIKGLLIIALIISSTFIIDLIIG
ncbi:MAG: hypothetical protein ACFFFY_12055 [Promethearchaeota archaeon]